ncbi:MAG TPA: hypothetical protein VFS05_08670 [Gemmatimonadaceae bacterium]|nr:hypothetical protein [Gemmatimonadaceae bacterium]
MSVDKLLGGIARELAHHHFSPAGLRAGIDVVGHVWQAARQQRVTRVRIDLLRETVEPVSIDTRDVREALGELRADLRRLLREQGIGPDHVASARATLEFTPAADASPGAAPGYACELEIVDERGKHHAATIAPGR